MSETRPGSAHLASTKPFCPPPPRKSRETYRNHPGYCHAASLFQLLQLPLLRNPSKRLRHHAGERVLPPEISHSHACQAWWPIHDMRKKEGSSSALITPPNLPTTPQLAARLSVPPHPASRADSRICEADAS